jgi:hypothetical protein
MNKEGGIFWGIGFWALFLGALILMNVGVVTYEVVKYPDYASAATTSTVAVTASVAQEISCSTASGSTAFGTLTTGSVTTSSPNATTTMSCGNVGGVCTLYVKDVNAGLATTSPSYTIHSPSSVNPATSSLAAGTEGYGIQATTTSAVGSGAALTLGLRYNFASSTSIVGGLTTSNLAIATTTATTTSRFINVTHKAAVSTVTQAASYTDTITYECTAT